tara:strand:+ start:296 stop:1195 length:900 start_codon:yes stop_codon:yes gene_type:complete
MAKKKTSMHNKAAALEEDPRTNMFQGKDRVDAAKEEVTETEDTNIEATMEATPEVEGFMDSKTSSPEPEGIMGGDTEVQYKKRYDDLKTYYDKKLSEWKQEKETLEAQAKVAEKQTPKYAPPKTDEDLDQFKDKYPDVYQVVETISHKMASKQVEDLQAEIGRISEREQKLKVQSAYKQLLHTHPDFEDIKNSPEFLQWLEQQPKSISEGITKNNTDPVWASRTVDLYKVDAGIGRKPKATKTKDAAKAVTKATSRDVNVGQNDKVWKISDIQRLKPWEFEKYESEIDQAMKSGRVINE